MSRFLAAVALLGAVLLAACDEPAPPAPPPTPEPPAAATATPTIRPGAEPTTTPMPESPAPPAPTPTPTPDPVPTDTPAPEPTPTATATPEAAEAPPVSPPGILAGINGPWDGIWMNNSFGSSGAARAYIDLREDGWGLLMLDLDGPVFGMFDPAAMIFEGTYDENGARLDEADHAFFGDLVLTVDAAGTLRVDAPAVPGANLGLSLEGQVAAAFIDASYEIDFGDGKGAEGIITLWPAEVFQESGVLILRVGDTESVLLDIADLPQFWDPNGWVESDQGFGIGADKFRGWALSPNGRWLAWAMAGGTHDLVGVLNVATGETTVLDFVFDGSAADFAWAFDSEHLAGAILSPAGALVEIYTIGVAPARFEAPRIFDVMGARDGWTTSKPRWWSTTRLGFTARDEVSGEIGDFELDLDTGTISEP